MVMATISKLDRITIVMGVDDQAIIDKHREALEEKTPGVKVSRSAAIRWLIRQSIGWSA